MLEEIVSAPKISIEHSDFISKTEEILNDVISTGNFELGFEYIKSLDEMGSTFDRAKSIMFSGMDKAWKPEEHEGETFLQAAVRMTGLHPFSINRHVKNQTLLSSGVIPEEYIESFEVAKENTLIQIANTVERGFELTKKDWRSLAEAAEDPRKVGRIVRKIKKELPRSNYYAITIDERGVLVGHTVVRKDGEREEIHVELGRLNIASKNEIVQKGINRLISCSGVLQSVEY